MRQREIGKEGVSFRLEQRPSRDESDQLNGGPASLYIAFLLIVITALLVCHFPPDNNNPYFPSSLPTPSSLLHFYSPLILDHSLIPFRRSVDRLSAVLRDLPFRRHCLRSNLIRLPTLGPLSILPLSLPLLLHYCYQRCYCYSPHHHSRPFPRCDDCLTPSIMMMSLACAGCQGSHRQHQLREQRR